MSTRQWKTLNWQTDNQPIWLSRDSVHVFQGSFVTSLAALFWMIWRKVRRNSLQPDHNWIRLVRLLMNMPFAISFRVLKSAILHTFESALTLDVKILNIDWSCFVFPLLPQYNQQNKTKQLGWCGIIIGKKTTTTTTTTTPPPPHRNDYILSHFQAT
jgi:hypothetical protein